MGDWKVTRIGLVVIAVELCAIALAIAAPRPWNVVGLVVAVVVALMFIVDGMQGGGIPGGYGTSIPMSDDERVSLFRRLFRPKRRC